MTRSAAGEHARAGGRSAGLVNSFSWVLGGNVLYALGQWAMLAVLVRLGGASMAGEFAFALALAGPLILFANMQLREMQAVDVTVRYPVETYLRLRLYTSAAAVLTAVILAVAARTSAGLAVVLAVSSLKAVEAAGEILYGHLQRNGRMDLMSKSMTAKALVAAPVLAAGPIVFDSLGAGVALVAGAWVAVIVWLDVPFVRAVDPRARLLRAPRAEEMIRLAHAALPLGLAMAFLSLNTNIPRYFLERHHGLAAVGIHAGIFNFVSALALLLAALGESAAPRLARAFTEGRRPEYVRLTLRLVAIAAVAAVAAAGAALVAGREALRVVYGPEFAPHAPSLAFAFAAAIAYVVSSMLGFALTAAGRFRELAALMVPVCLATVVASWTLVPGGGIDGALAAFGAGSSALALLCAFALARAVRSIDAGRGPLGQTALDAQEPSQPN